MPTRPRPLLYALIICHWEPSQEIPNSLLRVLSIVIPRVPGPMLSLEGQEGLLRFTRNDTGENPKTLDGWRQVYPVFIGVSSLAC